jgi:hypothetical protein
VATRMAATSRDPEEWAKATGEARKTREEVARELAGVVAEQVEALIVEGDIMGGRALVGRRLAVVLDAERRGDLVALRAAVMDLGAACGSWAAALDFDRPEAL